MNGEEILNEVRFLIDDHQYVRYNEINRAYRRIAHQSPHSWLSEESENVLSFVDGQTEYTMNLKGVRRITSLYVFGTDSGDQVWNYIEEADQDLFERKKSEHINLDGTQRPGLPEFFKTLSLQDDQIRIQITPEPSADMSAKINYVKEVSEIKRSTVPEMPHGYHDVIAQRAAGYILRSRGDKMGDVLIGEAEKDAYFMMMDSTSNKTKDVDKPKRPWIRSNSRSRFNRWRVS